MLDERESKLRQHLSALQEQQTHWMQSVEDLKKREQLVHEWTVSHLAGEKELDEANGRLAVAKLELDKRDIALADGEKRLEARERDVVEKERLAALSQAKAAEAELAGVALIEKLNADQVPPYRRVFCDEIIYLNEFSPFIYSL
jgi:hypothetical protein